MFKILVGSNTHPVFQEVMSVLKEQGFDLQEVACQSESNEQVLGQVAESHPDLVLLTPDLPQDYSYKLCKNLKGNPQTESIPVVFLSCANRQDKTAIDGLESGASDVLFIPNHLAPEQTKEVLARIHSVIRTKMTLHKSKTLADQLNQMNKELYERNLAVEQELYTTRQLQQSLLPPFLPDEHTTGTENTNAGSESEPQIRFSKCHFKNDYLKISGIYLPCDSLGGDLYDVIQFADHSIGVSVADVSGHGVPAAFVTAIFKAMFYRTTLNYSVPGDILLHLNNELMNIIKTGQYVTAIYTRLIEQTDLPGHYELQYAGAGHPYPYYYSAATNNIERLQENGTPLAWFKGMEYATGSVILKSGDKVLMFSDGVSEMKNSHGGMFGEENLGEIFQELIQKNTPNLLDALLQKLSDYAEGHPLDDDVSIVLIEMS